MNPSAPAHKALLGIVLLFAVFAGAFISFFFAQGDTVGITIGIVFSLVGVLLAALKPEVGVYAMALVLPVIGLKFQIFGLYFDFIYFASLLAATAFYARQIFDYLSGRHSVPFKLPLLIPFVAFFASVVISDIFNPYTASTLWYALRIIVFFYLVHVAFVYSVIRNQKVLRTSIALLAFSGVVVALSGTASLFQQYLSNTFFRVRPASFFGLYPFGDNHNLIGEFLVMTNFFLLALRFWAKSVQTKRVINLLFVFLVIVNLSTFSRATWIVTGIQLILYFWYKRTDRMTIAAIAIVALIAMLPVVSRMEALQEQNFRSTEGRLLMTQISWEAFKEKPLIGYGTGSFVGIIGDSIRYRAQYGDPLDSHGVWQKVMTENGLLGLLSFAVISYLIFSRLFRALHAYPKERELLLPLVIGALGVYLCQFFNTSYYIGKLWLPLAVALAAVEIVKRMYEPEKD